MDPLTILAVAQTAYGAIKAGIAAGKEIQHMAKDLSDLWGSLAKLTQIAAEPPKKSIFSNKSAEQIAEKLVEAAQEGEAWAVKEIMDRVDGKAVQSNTFEDAEGNSLLQAIEVRFVKPSE